MNALVVLSTAGAAAAVWYRLSLARPDGEPRITTFPNWKAIADSSALVLGPRNAPVSITVFTDFQCPFCRQFFEVVTAASAARPRDLRVLVRHFPIARLHPAASSAAMAAICAEAGPTAGVMHALMYRMSDSLGVTPWSHFARAAGLTDTLAFADCMLSERTRQRLALDLAAAKRVGVRGTPTILVNAKLVPFTPTSAALDSLIDAVLTGERDGVAR